MGRPLKAAKGLFGDGNTTEFVTWVGLQFYNPTENPLQVIQFN
jgi:hypothetical protein